MAPNASSTTAPTSTSAPVAISWTSTRGDAAPARARRLQDLGGRDLHVGGVRAGRAGPRRASPCAAAPARAPSRPPGTRSSRAASAAASRRRDRALLRASNAVELEQPRALRLVERTGQPAEQRGARSRGSGATADRATPARGRPAGRPARGSRPPPRGAPAGTAAAPRATNRFACGAVGQRAHRDRSRTRRRSPCAARRAVAQHGLGPHVLALQREAGTRRTR